MTFHIEGSQVIRFLLLVIMAAVLVTKLIDGLQKAGAIKDGTAGHWNQGLAFVVALAGFLLKYLGGDGQIADAQAFGLQLAAVLVTGFSVAVVAKLLHGVVLWLEGRHTARFLAPALRQ
jgi:hypothetical protein